MPGRLAFHSEIAERELRPKTFRTFLAAFTGGRNAASSSGSGLGLSIAQKIIKDHGGRISVDSTPGKGTTVSIVLPASIEVVAWNAAY